VTPPPPVTQLRTVPDRSVVWIEAHSNLHNIECEAFGLQGEGEASFGGDGLDLRVSPKGCLRMNVTSLRSGNAFQDAEMHRRMENRKFPDVIVNLVRVETLQGIHAYRFLSDLTFHGVTRRIDVEVTSALGRDGTVVVDGQFVLDVRSYNVTPPRILDLEVDPEVKIRVRLVLAQAGAPA
jgi:hypothetical protein